MSTPISVCSVTTYKYNRWGVMKAPGNCAKGHLWSAAPILCIAVTAHDINLLMIRRKHFCFWNMFTSPDFSNGYIGWWFIVSFPKQLDSNLFLILLLINSTAFPFPIRIPSIWSIQHFGTITDSSIGRQKRSLSSVPFLFAQTPPITVRSNHNVACLAFELIVWPPGKV